MTRKKDNPVAVEDAIDDGHVVIRLICNLVGEFDFTERTRPRKLRHPRFPGMRRDKAANEVQRETLADQEASP